MSEITPIPRLGAKIRLLGVSAGHASEIVNGKTLPSLVLAVTIEDALGIPPRFWVKRSQGVEVSPDGMGGSSHPGDPATTQINSEIMEAEVSR